MDREYSVFDTVNSVKVMCWFDQYRIEIQVNLELSYLNVEIDTWRNLEMIKIVLSKTSKG